MRNPLLAAMVLYSVVLPANAQRLELLPQGNVAARVDALFQKWDRAESPGCALSVMRDGHIIYKRGYSMSKQFTAASIVLLAQQGKLSPDDNVRKYIPELADFGTPISIRNLIYHTSGLRDQWILLGLAGWRYSLDLITDDDVMSVVTRQKELNFTPGDKYVYSNTGYTLLALIVKRVSGMSFREFTTKNIFEPLGMKNTHFRDDHAEIVKNNAYGYEPQKDAGFRLSNTNFDTVGPTSLHTTVEDLALWDENFYHPRVGGPDFVSQMLQRGKINNGDQIDYAFGLELGKYKGLPTVGHGGADAGYRSAILRFPEQHFSSAVLCNSSDAFPMILVQKVADLYLAPEMEAAASDTTIAKVAEAGAAIQLTEQQLSAVAGLYWNRDYDQFFKIYMKDSALHISSAGEADSILKRVTETSFHPADLPYGEQDTITFEPAAQGKQRRLLEKFEDEKPDVYESVEAFTPSTTALGDYPGEYVSEEIDPIYRIILQDGTLMLTRLKHEPTALEPRVRDAFSTPIGTIRFTRDASHHVSGFTLSNYAVRNFRFTRR
jgi:CubicO group peptidase (beta-lactamase class C family)